MQRFGITVYLWCIPCQSEFLVRCLAPRVRELRGAGRLSSFWFDRFDARGPHLFLVLTPDPVADDGDWRTALEEEIETDLKRHPCPHPLSDEELTARHVACRGKHLCSADALPGFAPPSSYLTFDHPADGFPYGHGAGLPGEERLWKRVTDLALWSVEELAGTSGTALAAGVSWIGAVDRALRARGEDAVLFWQYCAGRHLPSLPSRVAAGATTTADLERAVGESNRRRFEALWANGSDAPATEELVAVALGDPGARGDGRWTLLRELVQGQLKQLGCTVRHQLPMVLHALTREAGTRRSGGEGVR